MNAPSRIILSLIFFWPVTPIQSQTNQTNRIISTKRAAQTSAISHPDYRVVNGQLYNIRRSQVWSDLTVQVQSLAGGIAIANVITYEPIRTREWQPGRSGSPLLPEGQRAGYRTVTFGQERVLGRAVRVRNLPDQPGAEITIRAMRVAAAGGELRDCGLPYYGPLPGMNAAAGEQLKLLVARLEAIRQRAQILVQEEIQLTQRIDDLRRFKQNATTEELRRQKIQVERQRLEQEVRQLEAAKLRLPP